MKKESKVYYPVGGFEDIKAFDLEEFGDIENPNFVFTPETVIKMTDLASFRLVNAANFADRKEYDVAIEVTKSALWLLEILNKKFPYKEQET